MWWRRNRVDPIRPKLSLWSERVGFVAMVVVCGSWREGFSVSFMWRIHVLVIFLFLFFEEAEEDLQVGRKHRMRGHAAIALFSSSFLQELGGDGWDLVFLSPKSGIARAAVAPWDRTA